MKKHDYITILGTNSIKMSPQELREYGPVISVTNKKLNFKHIDYVWTRQEPDLLWFLQQRPSPVECVTTPDLYKKYVFYDKVHSFPPISPQFNLTLDVNTDDQTLTLLSAIGLADKSVMLVGCDVVLNCWANMADMVSIVEKLSAPSIQSQDRMSRVCAALALVTTSATISERQAALIERRDELMSR